MTRARILISAALMAAACFVSLSGGLGAQVQRQVRNLGIGDRAFRPVTDAMLEKPEPGEWINWRRTYDGTGYSPLTQINRQNVGQLKLAWSWGMPAGAASADAARTRRRDVPADARRRRAGGRRHQRRFPVGVPRAAAGGRQRQRAQHADAQHRDLRRQTST